MSRLANLLSLVPLLFLVSCGRVLSIGELEGPPEVDAGPDAAKPESDAGVDPVFDPACTARFCSGAAIEPCPADFTRCEQTNDRVDYEHKYTTLIDSSASGPREVCLVVGPELNQSDLNWASLEVSDENGNLLTYLNFTPPPQSAAPQRICSPPFVSPTRQLRVSIFVITSNGLTLQAVGVRAGSALTAAYEASRIIVARWELPSTGDSLAFSDYEVSTKIFEKWTYTNRHILCDAYPAVHERSEPVLRMYKGNDVRSLRRSETRQGLNDGWLTATVQFWVPLENAAQNPALVDIYEVHNASTLDWRPIADDGVDAIPDGYDPSTKRYIFSCFKPN